MNNQAKWIKWNGGDQPVADGVMVDVKYDGDIDTDLAGEYYWHHDCNPGNITAYRLHNAFKDQPDWATHLVTTGPEWVCDKSMIGEICPAIYSDGLYHDDHTRWGDFFIDSTAWVVIAEREDEPSATSDTDTTPEYTGGSVSYYTVAVNNPTNPDREPYEAECNDIIEALDMNYAEANLFKAVWRKCAARTYGNAKAGYKDGLYDSEKAVFFSQRMVEQEKLK